MGVQLRFGVVSESVPEGRAWLDYARQVEGAGISALLLRDHFSAGAFGQQLAPFSALAAAAAVTERLHVGTMVLCNDFRHPAIVAHEAASLHRLSGGRFELGLGAGWYQPEYDAAGIPFDPPGQRISRLEESLAVIGGLLDHRPVHHQGPSYRIDGLSLDVLPAQHGRPRLLIGAGGPRMLRIAARHADTVGLLPAPSRARTTPMTPATACRPRWSARSPSCAPPPVTGSGGWNSARSPASPSPASGGPAPRSSSPAAAGAGTDVETVWDMPTVFIGSAAQIRADLGARRDRFGLSYLISSDRDLPALAEIAAGL